MFSLAALCLKPAWNLCGVLLSCSLGAKIGLPNLKMESGCKKGSFRKAVLGFHFNRNLFELGWEGDKTKLAV